MKDASIKKALAIFEKQSGNELFYNLDLIENLPNKDFSIEGDDSWEALKKILDNTSLSYNIRGKMIIIFPEVKRKNQITIRGTVKDEDGSALSGVSVFKKGTNTGTSTNENGSFELRDISIGDIIRFNSLGYVQKEITVTGPEINLVLVREVAGLEEVVVVGYGTRKRETLTGSVATVDSKEIAEVPASNLTSTLSGRLAGVRVNQNSGKPGGSSNLSVRADGTWNNTSPLYVIDGVIRDKFAFDAIDPSEVENLSVLKDGASAAIYGSRAANGVVLVTTKKGKAGKPIINYIGSIGSADATKIQDVFSTYEQAVYTNESYKNQLIPENDSRYYAQDELEYFKQSNYNWLEIAWKNPLVARNSVNISGGGDKVRYFLGGNQYYESGTFKNLDFKKYSFRSNIEADITKDLNVYFSLNMDNRDDYKPYWKWDNDSENLSNLYNGLLRRGLFEPYIDGKANGTFLAWHPLEVINGKTGYNRKRYSNYEMNVSLTYKVPFVPGLNLKVMYNKYDRHQFIKQFNRPYPLYVFKTTGSNNHIPTTELESMKIRDDGDFLYENYTRNENYQLNAMATYQKEFGLHDINALLVYEQAEGTSDWFEGQRNYFISSAIDQLFAGSSDPKNSTVNGSGSEFGRLSYVGRLSYNYAQKYIFESSFRYDGSVNFAPGHRWGFFPSVSAAYRISQENYFKKALPFFNDFKIRAAVGLLGNDAVGGWQWMQRYKMANGAYFGTLSDGVYADVIPNKTITWEKSLSYDVGVDFVTLENRLAVNLGAFYKKTYDILGNRIASLPTTFGANMPAENYAKINTKGFEIDLSYSENLGENFNYRLGGNLTYAINKLIQKDEAQNLRPYRSEIGFNTDRAMGYVATDIIRTQADLEALPANYTIFGMKPELGMLNYKDIRGVDSDLPDGKIDVNDQDWIINHTIPPVNYGFNLGLSWKTISLDVLFQGVSGGRRFYDQRTEWGGMEATSYGYIRDYWTTQNIDATFPRAGSNNGANEPSSFWVLNTSFLRLKNISIGYQIPNKITSKLGIQSLKLYALGTNLFLLQDKIKEYDPENSSIMAYPMMKTYSLGVNLSF